MLTADKVKDILLDELRAKGYSPNPADVSIAVVKILELAKESLPEVKAPVTPPKL
jgi:hypothetical protein